MTKKNFNKLMHFSDIETAYKNDQYPDAECMLTYPGEVTDNRPFTPAGVNLKPVTITENGEYNPASFDADGFSWVDVDVEGHAEPVLEPLVCNYNGTFTPPEGVDGFDSVTTNIHPANPYVGNFTSNQSIHVDGEYNGVDITVDVDAITNELTVTENGTYTPPTGVDGFSEVDVNVPPTYAGNTLKYLCYASFTGTDPATTDVNYPLDVKSYGGYDDYLTYNNNTNEIVVKKDFTAVIMLWDVNYAVGSHPAIMGLKLNGNWVISPIRTSSNSVNSVGTINTSFKSLDPQTGPLDTYIPDKSNCILIPLHVGDSLSIQKPVDHGWLHAYIKIYKLFDSTTSTDNFMNSIITTSNTSNYVNVNVGGDLIFDSLTATRNGQYTPTHDGFSNVTVAVQPDMPLNSVQISSISNKYMGAISTSLPIEVGYYGISFYHSDQIAGDTNLAIVKIDTLPTTIHLGGLSNFRINVTTNSVEVDNYDGSAKDVYMSIVKIPDNAICVKPD